MARRWAIRPRLPHASTLLASPARSTPQLLLLLELPPRGLQEVFWRRTAHRLASCLSVTAVGWVGVSRPKGLRAHACKTEWTFIVHTYPAERPRSGMCDSLCTYMLLGLSAPEQQGSRPPFSGAGTCWSARNVVRLYRHYRMGDVRGSISSKSTSPAPRSSGGADDLTIKPSTVSSRLRDVSLCDRA